MDKLTIVIIAILLILCTTSVAGYCVREYDMWCSSQEPQTCSDIDRVYPACN